MTKKQIVEIGAVFLLIIAGAYYVETTGHELGEGGEITRNAYGEGSKEVELILNADSVLENYAYTLTVEQTKVTEREAGEYFLKAKKEIDATFPKDGQTLDHVSERVNMQQAYVDGKVSADWYFDDYSCMDTDGNVIDEKLDDEGKIILAEVELTCGDYKELYTFSFMVYPRELDKAEHLVKEIDAYVKEQQSQEGMNLMKLPDSMDGITLGWAQAKEHLVPKVMLLEGIILVMLPLVQRNRKKEEQKKRQEAFMLDYPEMVSRINVLVGAGMTIKQAWNRISAQYLDNRKKNTVKEILVFEEMAKTDREIRDGESERIAYQRFADRIDISAYYRFVRLIISNLQKGNRGLCELLEQESEKAFAERRLLARRLGEEAGTKLLFPMMLMLAIVMAIVIVPAMQGFTM